ncbi:GIY-YIG nuclease family protein [Hymenobacter sp. BT491]|uniref:GIY-YIG nuclease family protein n=1 Tax=Hymenobacter sp. BT491 TaxID=2766779 RepID=UPI001653A3FF|nr:GIY-YIG nuclease family protein [Hymenobacter sp. BT491]MBC6989318.1 GIY-YIG nuclease family protein [Hymenobacter sp. BT491]
MFYYVYVTTNPGRNVLYIGVTRNLSQRMAEHYANRGTPQTFAGKYFCYNLVYFEQYTDSKIAIAREKELKGWTRAKKEVLIASQNAGWEFLAS